MTRTTTSTRPRRARWLLTAALALLAGVVNVAGQAAPAQAAGEPVIGGYELYNNVTCWTRSEINSNKAMQPDAWVLGKIGTYLMENGTCDMPNSTVPYYKVLFYKATGFNCGAGHFTPMQVYAWGKAGGLLDDGIAQVLANPCVLGLDASLVWINFASGTNADMPVTGMADPFPSQVAGPPTFTRCGTVATPDGGSMKGYFVAPTVLPYQIPLKISQNFCIDGKGHIYQPCPQDDKAKCPAPADPVINFPAFVGNDAAWQALQALGVELDSKILTKGYVQEGGKLYYRMVIEFSVKACPINLPVGCATNKEKLQWDLGFGADGRTQTGHATWL